MEEIEHFTNDAAKEQLASLATAILEKPEKEV